MTGLTAFVRTRGQLIFLRLCIGTLEGIIYCYFWERGVDEVQRDFTLRLYFTFRYFIRGMSLVNGLLCFLASMRLLGHLEDWFLIAFLGYSLAVCSSSNPAVASLMVGRSRV